MNCGAKERKTLKPGWMRYWASVSALLLMTTPVGAHQGKPSHLAGHSARDNEWKLAGLLPGHTALFRAEAILGEPFQKNQDDRSATWHTCFGDEVSVDTDDKKIVQAVRVSKNLSKEAKT